MTKTSRFPFADALLSTAPRFATVDPVAKELYGVCNPVFDRDGAEQWLDSHSMSDRRDPARAYALGEMEQRATPEN